MEQHLLNYFDYEKHCEDTQDLKNKHSVLHRMPVFRPNLVSSGMNTLNILNQAANECSDIEINKENIY